MLNRTRFENSKPDGFPVLEVVAGDDIEGSGRRFVALKQSAVTGEITGPLAQLCLAQTFSYTHDECPLILEALYRFPLPGDAAVLNVTVSFGEVEIRAELKERSEAEAAYAAAKNEGRQAALATREAPDVFTLRIAGIKPDEAVCVRTSYTQLARAEGAGWSVRIPLTTAPRFVREDERGSRAAQGQPLAIARDPGHRFALDVTLAGEADPSSPTHELAISESTRGLRVQLRDGEVLPDRDCVLHWTPRTSPRPLLQIFLHRDAPGKPLFFVACVAPPAVSAAATIPREVILLVDHSGSMSGSKWEAADWSVTSFLSGLPEHDVFTLGLFHDRTRWLSRQSLAANPANVRRAMEFLAEHRDSGGTQLGVALEQALHVERTPGELPGHVLIVTDAEVTDSARVLRLAEQERSSVFGRRISVLCIDAAPNSHLANELAERGGGVARFLTSSPEQEDITTALEDVLKDWAAPVFTGLRLQVDRASVEAAGRTVTGTAGGSTVDLGDLPSGRCVWVAGRVPEPGAKSVTFVLTCTQGRLSSVTIEPQQAESRPGIKAAFGARRVLALEYLAGSYQNEEEVWAQLERMGHRPESLLTARYGARPRVYAENLRERLAEVIRSLIAQEALEAGLASAETAFVAIRTEPGPLVDAVTVIPNAYPAGWADDDADGVLDCAICGYAPSASYSVGASPIMGFSKRAPASASPSPCAAATEPIWAGAPTLANGEAVLFDTSRSADAGKIGRYARLRQLSLRFCDGVPARAWLDRDLMLLLFVDDPLTPQVRVRVADLVQQGGNRPLNVLYGPGQMLRLVLSDPNGSWATAAPRIEVRLT